MKENTDKKVCRELAQLLADHGVKRVFLSPGSRNAPIIVAIARSERLETTVVIDERCAAFMAMGYASISGEPVAIVCTSGTALLNYAPAVAEAYYRRLPLVVISADRPTEWIDQDDSQTLRQPGALDNYVKLSCDIPEVTTDNLQWYANRVINDALICAQTGRKAPVHINLQLDAPLGRIVSVHEATPRKIDVVTPREDLDMSTMAELRSRLASPRKVMIIAGFNAPDHTLSSALKQIAQWPNVTVLTETISNLHDPAFVQRIDTTLCQMIPEEMADMAPDVVITLGGALVSRFVKEYIRGLSHIEHWHVGVAHTTIDCFRHLSLRVEIEPRIFFSQLAAVAFEDASEPLYRQRWYDMYQRACKRQEAYIRGLDWTDMQAFATFMPRIPREWNVQWSNGTPIRYAQLFGDNVFHRSDCNRGVSGIDGCTSTAIGAAMADEGRVTLLVSGDMSAQYDVGALATVSKLRRFKMIVMCNGGGGIFRFIGQTALLAELDEYFAVGPVVPLRELAQGYGMSYHEAHDRESLKSALSEFIDEPGSSLLAVYTPAKESAVALHEMLR